MNKIIHMKSKRHWPWVPHVEAGAAPPNRSTGAACGAILLANGLLAAAAGAAAPESRENKSPPPEAAGWDGDVTGEPEPSRSMLACGENGFVAGPLLFSFSIFSACKKQSCWISLPKQVESKRRGGSKLLKTERDTVINFVQENYVKDTDVLVSLKKNRSTCRGFFFFFFFLCFSPVSILVTLSDSLHPAGFRSSQSNNPECQARFFQFSKRCIPKSVIAIGKGFNSWLSVAFLGQQEANTMYSSSNSRIQGAGRSPSSTSRDNLLPS